MLGRIYLPLYGEKTQGDSAMNEHFHSLKEIPLLPDSELLAMMEEAESTAQELRQRARDRESRRRRDQIFRRLEALSDELEARGISGPPWWSERS